MLNRKSLIIVVLSLSLLVNAWVVARKVRAVYSEHHPVTHPNAVAMLGDSLTNLGDWSGDFKGETINCGVRGDTTGAILKRLDSVIAIHPKSVFLMAGTNDILSGVGVDTAVSNFTQIVRRIRSGSPQTVVYMESVLPVTDRVPLAHRIVKGRATELDAQIQEMNQRIAVLADSRSVFFVSLHDDFLFAGQLAPEYTLDGVHLTAHGYKVWQGDLFPFIER